MATLESNIKSSY